MVVGEIEIGTDVLIVGSGPAGYTAAIRGGQLGLDVTIAGTQMGGVCLNLGCIPIKALMHSLDMTLEARKASVFGVDEQATLDMHRAQAWKDTVVGRLEQGIRRMLQASSAQVLEGICSFESSSEAIVKGRSGSQRVHFKRAVIATGSHFKMPDGVRMDGARVTNPYGITRLRKVPGNAVVLGGGLGGATTASLLAKMGARVALAYRGSAMVAAIDDDVMQPAVQWFQENGVQLFPGATWTVAPDGSSVKIASGGEERGFQPDVVVFATPQEANTGSLNLGRTRVELDAKGFIVADDSFRTTDPSIYAIGDVLGGARNASTAYRDGMSVAEILAGKPGLPGYQAVPFTMYTEPPIASAGLTEKLARKRGIDVIVGRSPYSANGAAVLSGDTAGLAKVVAEKASGRILGVQVVGQNATDIIAEGALAIEMGARLEDVALTLHPHPELCEVFYDACARGAGLSGNVMPRR